MKERTYYLYLDTLKGIAILLMIMAHIIAWSFQDASFLQQPLSVLSQNELNSAFIYKLIYSFHMSLLFFISGYLFYKKEHEYNYNYIKKALKGRIQRLLVPYITTGIFVYLLRGYFGYWFLQVLFILNVIVLLEFFLLNQIKKSIYIDLCSHLLFFSFLFIFVKLFRNLDYPKEFFGLATIEKYYLAFIGGVLLKKYGVIEALINKQSMTLMSFLLFCLLFYIQQFSQIPGCQYLIPICAIIFLYNVVKHKNWGGWMTIIGKYSLEIYILHIFFAIAFKEVGNFILTIDDFPTSITFQITYSTIISIISIILSIGTANLISGSKILSLVFFGKS